MRILRGLFRLWVVASVIWMLSVGVMTWLTWPVEPKASSETVVLENGHGCFELHFGPVRLWDLLRSPILFIRFAANGSLF